MFNEDDLTEIYREDDVSSPQIEVRYVRPKFVRRVMANLLDAILLVLVFFGCFLGARAIVTNSPDYKSKNKQLETIRLESGLYVYDYNHQFRDLVTYINQDENNTGGSKVKKAKKGIETFLSYTKENAGQEIYEEIKKDYDDYRLDSSLTYEDKAMFVLQDGEVMENEELVGGAKDTFNIFNIYFEKAYAPYIDKHLQGYLLTKIPNYYELTKYDSLMLIFAEAVPAYCLAGILVYLVPTLFFRRGRMTLGKFLYKIGLVDKRVLSPTLGRSLARFAIFYFGELILSIVSFGAPYIISFTLMAFSKNKQGFPDYILGLNEIDTSMHKIYFDYQEIELDKIETNKEPVKFKVKNYD